MNCCDYNCNQGRDCPARKTPAIVAHIGQRHHAATPMPRARWRDEMPAYAACALVAIVLVLAAVAAGVIIVVGVAT